MRSFLPGSQTPSLTLADKLVWVSAFMPQPLRRIQVIHVFWKEEHQPGAWVAGASPLPGLFRVLRPLRLRLSVQMVQRPPLQLRRLVLRGWESSSDENDCYHASASSSKRFSAPWVSSSLQPPLRLDVRVPPTPPVSLPPGIQSPPASDIGSTLTSFRAVDCPVRLREDDAFPCLRSLEIRLVFRERIEAPLPPLRPRPRCDFICPVTKNLTPQEHIYSLVGSK